MRGSGGTPVMPGLGVLLGLPGTLVRNSTRLWPCSVPSNLGPYRPRRRLDPNVSVPRGALCVCYVSLRGNLECRRYDQTRFGQTAHQLLAIPGDLVRAHIGKG